MGTRPMGVRTSVDSWTQMAAVNLYVAIASKESTMVGLEQRKSVPVQDLREQYCTQEGCLSQALLQSDKICHMAL